MTAAVAPAASSRLLTVSVAGDWYGLPVGRVRTIFRLGAVAPVPLGPPAVLGLVNLRGAILPALSLRRRLRLPESAAVDGRLAVSLDHDAEVFALVVDEVGEVIAVEAADAVPAPPHMSPALTALTDAVFRLADKVLPVLDVSFLATGAPVDEGTG